VVGLLLRSVRVFRQFAWLEVGSGKVALSRPAHQYPADCPDRDVRGITHTVGRLMAFQNHVKANTTSMMTPQPDKR
jgi:hypothetical protein